VLHRHFADVDTFLTELVVDRVARIEDRAVSLRSAAGAGTVAGNVSAVLTDLFGSVGVAIVSLITFRDGLRARLRAAGLTGVPVLTQATAMLAGYLAAERDRGRVAAGTDVETLALTLIGTGHLLFAGRDGEPPDSAEVDRMLASVLADAVSGENR